jgi:hypothetical protein
MSLDQIRIAVLPGEIDAKRFSTARFARNYTYGNPCVSRWWLVYRLVSRNARGVIDDVGEAPPLAGRTRCYPYLGGLGGLIRDSLLIGARRKSKGDGFSASAYRGFHSS